MAQSLVGVVVHMIYSTKDRKPTLPEDVRPDLNAYLAGVLANLGCPAILIGSVADHAHILFALSKTASISDVAQATKVESSKWMKKRSEWVGWQSGYGAFSVSQSKVPAVREYILGQEEHHRRQSFQEEFREFLERHGVAYDDRYVWA